MKEWKKKYKSSPLSMFKELRLIPGWDKPTTSIEEEIYLTCKFAVIDYQVPHLNSWDILVQELNYINKNYEKSW